MHAIAGIVSPAANPALRPLMQQMVDRLCHDASDEAGQCAFDHLGLRVGWMRRRDSAAPLGPIWSDRHHVGVIFAGEEFSPSVSTPNGHGNSSAGTAARRLANSYAEVGSAAFGALNGWFSGVLIDIRNDSVTLFNDRFGVGRIYYHDSAEGFYFSSEAKSLLAVRPATRRLDARGLGEWFAVGCVLQNRTLFAGISVLPPACAWTFHHNGRITRNRYFDPRTWEEQPPLPAAEYDAQLRALFSRCAPRYARGAVAMSLTGGLDSRAVMAWVGREPGALPCYTFGGAYRDCADVRIARRLAAVCRHPHTTIRVGRDLLASFASLAEQTVYRSDGTMDVSGAVELHVNQQARTIAPVRLTGNYGSEILRAHVAFRPRSLDAGMFTPEFVQRIDEAADTYATEAAGHRLSFIAFKQVPWHHHARLSIERSQLTPRSPFLDNEVVALAYRAPPALTGSTGPLLRLIAAGNPSLARLGTDRAHRLDPVPLLGRAITAWQEFTARAEYAYDYGMPHWLARADGTLMALRLEKLFLGRHKFYHFRIWYRDALRDYVRSQAAQCDLPSMCYREGVPARIAEEHVAGRRNHTLELHRLFTVQLIHQTLLRAA